MAETNDTTSTTQTVKTGRLWWVGLLAAGVASVGNILVMVITNALFAIPASFRPFAVPPIVIFTVLSVAAATGVFALLGRFTQRPIYWFWIVSVIVLLLSFVPNILTLTGAFPMPGTTVPGVVALMVMHVVAAAAAVGLLIGLAGEG